MCKTRNCTREVAGVGHAYCQDCFLVVWRTGEEPVIAARLPRWRQWTQDHQNSKDMTRAAA